MKKESVASILVGFFGILLIIFSILNTFFLPESDKSTTMLFFVFGLTIAVGAAISNYSPRPENRYKK